MWTWYADEGLKDTNYLYLSPNGKITTFAISTNIAKDMLLEDHFPMCRHKKRSIKINKNNKIIIHNKI